MRKKQTLAILTAMLILACAFPALSQTNSIIGQINVVGRSDQGGVTVWVDSLNVTQTLSTGYYMIDLPDGEYTVHAWVENCLAVVIDTVTVSGQDVTGIDGELFAGDLLPDGIIDLHDLRILLDHYMETPDSSGWDEGCDILTDQVIDSLDIDLLASRWKESADSRLPDWPVEPIEVTCPDTETTWFIGGHNMSIEWHPGHETGDVSIYLMTYDSIMDTIAAATANDGLFDEYDVPLSLPAGGGYRVEITTGTGNVAASENFGIRQMLTVYDPDSMSVWRPGYTGKVQWWNRAGLTSPVSVYLYKGEELRYTIVEGRPYDEEFYHWPVPLDIEAGGDYRVMARYDDSPEIFDFSDYFAIRPVFKVLRPNNYTYWIMGEKGVAIEWEDAGLGGNVEIKLYKGTAWNVITTATENDGLYVDYNYTVPATFSPGDDFSVGVFHSVEHNDLSRNFEVVQPPVPADLGWDSINNTGTLRDVFMGGSEVTAAVGEWGRIIWTADGGYTWTEQESGTYRTLYGISVSGDLTGTAVGMYGLILQTIDGGQNWERRRPDIANTLYDVSQADVNTAIAVGDDGMVIRTNDGGTNWEVLSSGVQSNLYTVHFIDIDNGWAGGSGGMMIRTGDGGDSWTVMDSGTSSAVWDIDFISNNIGARLTFNVNDWGLYNQSVMVTHDGGSSWPFGRFFNSGYEYYSAVAFADLSTLTVVMESMYRSTDGGETWGEQPDNMFDVLYGIDYFPGGTGFTVGSSGVVLRTVNSGSAWSPVRPGVIDIKGIDHIDPLTYVIVGGHGLIMRTTDGGSNWTWVESVTTSDLQSVSFAPEGRGIATGTGRAISWTLDDGLSWMPTYPALAPASVYDATIVNYPAAVAVGEGGRIVRTGDGGATWGIVSSGTSESLHAVSFVDINSGTIVGNAGTILGTSDGGINWTPRSSGTTEDLYDIKFINASNGMTVGASGVILRTGDGGVTWTALTSGTSVSLVSVDYSYPNAVTVVGDDGTILRTDNNGASWYIQEGGTTRGLRGISYGGLMEGIIVGDTGTILHTTTGGE